MIFARVGKKHKRRSFETRDATLASPDDWLVQLFAAGFPTIAGPPVSPLTAMRCTPVRRAVQAIAEACGQIPVATYKHNADGSKAKAPDHPVARVLRDEANPWTSAAEFREQLTRDALLHGNGYAFVNRADDKVQELIRLAPGFVSTAHNVYTQEPIYRITDESGQREIDWRNVIHLKAPSFDGVTGDSPVQQGRQAISLALSMEEHAARLFANGARPSGLLKFPKTLAPETAKRIKASWNAAHAGGGASGSTAVLEDGGDFTPLTFNSVDSQFLELRKFAIEEIARIFGVPPTMLFELGRATWGNAEEMGASFVTFTLMRWVKAWEGQFRLKLFSPDERDTYFAEFQIDDLLRADFAQRAVGYGQLIAARVMNPNEVRLRENLPPYEGGDVFANPNTMTAPPPLPRAPKGPQP